MALPKIILVTKDIEFAKTAKAALGGAVVLSLPSLFSPSLPSLSFSPSSPFFLSSLPPSFLSFLSFLPAIKEKHPKITRIAVTGTSDFEQAMQLVNSADISWLLTKPCAPKELLKAVTDSVTRYRKDRAESEAMKDTLIGCVKMLVDIMELTHPEAVSQSKRILRRAQQINRHLKAMSPQFMDMVVLLSNIGCVGLSPNLIKKMREGTGITKEDMKTFRTHPSIAARLLENVPRMGKIAEIILHQNTPCSQNPPLAARILKVCIDLDQLKIKGASPEKALAHMNKRPEIYDPRVIKTMARLQTETRKAQPAPISVAGLKPGMVMQQDMVTEDGATLLRKGETLSEASHMRLQTFNDLLKIKDPIYATTPGAAPSAKK
jgi:hypothetical protein